MSIFARANHYLTLGTRLMIPERLMTSTPRLDSPLSTCRASVQAMLNQLEESIAMQNEEFQNLVLGYEMWLEEVLRRAPANWYIESDKAVELGLVGAVI